jgi:hypothetical protein
MSDIKSLKVLEDSVAILNRREKTETAILGSIALVGFLGLALLAPNAVQVLQHVVPDIRPISQKQSVRRAIGRLIKKGYIQKSGKKYRLTNEGQLRLDKLLVSSEMRNKLQLVKQKWDGKWRIVIFDIKESRRTTRDELRNFLVQTGFSKLQDSVWVYPFRCDEVVAILKFKLTLGWDLVYIIADAIEGDEWLREKYNLPKA